MDEAHSSLRVRGVQVDFNLGGNRISGTAAASITDAKIEQGVLVISTGTIVCRNAVRKEITGPIPDYLRGVLPPEELQDRLMHEILEMRAASQPDVKRLETKVSELVVAFRPLIDTYATSFWDRAARRSGEHALDEIRSAALEGFMEAVGHWVPGSKCLQRLALIYIRYACVHAVRDMKAPAVSVSTKKLSAARKVLWARKTGGGIAANQLMDEMKLSRFHKPAMSFLATVLDQPTLSFNDERLDPGCDSVMEECPDGILRKEVIDQIRIVLETMMEPREMYMFLMRHPFEELVPWPFPTVRSSWGIRIPVVEDLGERRYRLEEIGAVFGFSKERARQYMDRILDRLGKHLRDRGIDRTIFREISNCDSELTYFPEGNSAMQLVLQAS